jgi:hypothetical protein
MGDSVSDDSGLGGLLVFEEKLFYFFIIVG